MARKDSENQKKSMSRMFRGKAIFKPLNTGWIDEHVACVREWIANVARVSMKDELEIIRQWQELLKANVPENLQELTDILVQLEILYWNQTKPKTSRKQLEYLMDLLEPNKISEEYYSLYKQIVWKA